MLDWDLFLIPLISFATTFKIFVIFFSWNYLNVLVHSVFVFSILLPTFFLFLPQFHISSSGTPFGGG